MEAQEYKKLVEALRCCGNEGCHKCPYQKHIHEKFCWVVAMKDAADAIEDLQKGLTALQKCYEIADKKVDELLTQLPKRGKWIGVSPMVDTVQCSVCGGQLFSAELETPYCPYCGAEMEVQDGKD